MGVHDCVCVYVCVCVFVCVYVCVCVCVLLHTHSHTHMNSISSPYIAWHMRYIPRTASMTRGTSAAAGAVVVAAGACWASGDVCGDALVALSPKRRNQ